MRGFARLYANETTIHGVSDVVEPPSKPRQAIWVVILLVSAALLSYEIYRIAHQHLNMPYGTRVDIVQLQTFPVIGICPPETVDVRKAVRSGLSLDAVQLIHSVLPDIESAWFDPYAMNGTISQTTKQEVEAFRSQFDTYSDMLKSLSYDAMPYNSFECVNCKQPFPIHEKVVRSNGVCFHVDESEIPKSLEIGTRIPHLQWSFELSERDVLEITCATEIYLTEIPVSDYGMFMKRCMNSAGNSNRNNETESFGIPLAFRVTIGRQAEQFNNLGDIQLDHMMDARVLVNIIERRLIEKDGRCLPAELETFVPCQLECMNDRMRSHCGITCSYYLGEAAEVAGVDAGNAQNLTFCNLAFLDTLYDNSTNVKQASCLWEAEDYCDSTCLKPCRYFIYEPSVIPINRGYDNGAMAVIIRPLHPEAMLRLVEIKTYTWDTFLSNIGGMVGLFCGASILSVAHLVTFCLCGPRGTVGKSLVRKKKKQCGRMRLMELA